MTYTGIVPMISRVRRDNFKEGLMLRTSFIVATAAMCGSVLIGSVAAIAAAVTDADLRGKKICWNTGIISTFGKDGSIDSNRSGHGTWRLSGDQLTLIMANGNSVETITKDGGSFHRTRRASGSGTDIESWGSYCN
jgi:hypothetical protein